MELLQKIRNMDTKDKFKLLTFDQYLGVILKNPEVTRNSFQRLHDMVMSYGQSEYSRYGKKHVHYNFFDDPFSVGKAIFGLDWSIMTFMNVLKSAALGYGQEKRILLLVGPVGSSKSSMVDLLKLGLEDYSKRDEGRLYGTVWYAEKGTNDVVRRSLGFLNEFDEEVECEMHCDPINLLRLIYEEGIVSDDPLRELNKNIHSDYRVRSWCYPCPKCDDSFSRLLKHYRGNWQEIIRNHVRVRRIIISDKRRVCIGTLQPKHEKDQDATELTGDVNYRAVAEYGRESDPRAFNFEGEFQKANRGIMEFIEGLKLDVAFLYDLLEASQAHRIKARKLGHMDIDEVIIAHTNPPDLKKLEKNELMLALKDRTTQIPVPYVIRLEDEKKIYERDYRQETIKSHIAPHTIEVAAMWSVLTHIEPPKEAGMDIVQKMKLYNGQELENWSLEVCKKLREEHPDEGFTGISPRYIQDKFSNAVINSEHRCVNPFTLMYELRDGLKLHSSISTTEREKCMEMLGVVEREFDEMIREEVQEAILGDEQAIQKLCANYIDNVKAFTRGEKVTNRFTGKDDEPDERLMRSVEEKVDITENKKDDWRREIMNHIGALAMEGEKFRAESNEKLHKALRRKLFEDQKDTMKLSSLVETVKDEDTERKINEVKNRLIKTYGYCDECATGVLTYVGGLFARQEEEHRRLSTY
ncbi:MAG: serine protein kinase [Deltaproteobacteria bacterium HGW-Deltaproteobacteria-15]|jgi:serine protein kinase|nr:MAG: serine protein kinase [Deltaproteobacteria bacterium HGW-Deltaproteobacteria-15]